MEISHNTILKSILGSVVHFTKSLQVENKLSYTDAKSLAYSMLDKSIKTLLEVKDSDVFYQELNKQIEKYRSENKKDTLLALLTLKDFYEKSR